MSLRTSPRPGVIIIWCQWPAPALILRSSLYSKIEHKTQSDTRRVGRGIFFSSSTHGTQKGNKLRGSGKLLKWKLFNFLQLAQAATSLAAGPSKQLQQCELHFVTELQCLVTQAAAVSPRIAPSSLISPSEARRLWVINSPPDTNLFQLLRGRGKTNTHITCLGVASQTSGISQSCSPSPGTGQPTERIIIYDLCHFYFPRSFKWRKECLVCDVLAASRLRPRRF